MDRLTTILKKRIQGHACLDDESLVAASRDFGGIVSSRPQVVVWPDNTDDVVAIVRTARETKTPLSVRGAGHSQGGQALSRGGIVIQTQRLNRIESFKTAEGRITAGAGMSWRDLVATTIESKLLPAVLTDYLHVTLGGTLAVGGLGPASFRQGAQVDHCSGLEIVLGTGEVAWLSAEHQPHIFDHVLGGLGQFGVVTKVELRLRPAPRFIRTHYLRYDNLETFLTDAQQLMARESVHLLSGCAVPKEHSGAESSHDVSLTNCTELDQLPSPSKEHAVDGVRPETQWHEDLSTRDFLSRFEAIGERFQRPAESRMAHPWVEHFLPLSAVPEYVAAVTHAFPMDAYLLWPLRTANLRRPMMSLPDSDDIMLVGILCSRFAADIAVIMPRLKQIDDLGVALGGKRYLSGWLDFDINRWRRHYGVARWREITSVQVECDPDGLFRLWRSKC
jgi:FAD/FMN-containing dehydrogenase